MAIIMLALSVTVLKMFAVEGCISLTLTFRIGEDQSKTCQSQGHASFYSLAIIMFALSIAVCEIIMYKLSNILDTNLTGKLKVKDVDDLDENWQMNLLSQRACVY